MQQKKIKYPKMSRFDRPHKLCFFHPESFTLPPPSLPSWWPALPPSTLPALPSRKADKMVSWLLLTPLLASSLALPNKNNIWAKSDKAPVSNNYMLGEQFFKQQEGPDPGFSFHGDTEELDELPYSVVKVITTYLSIIRTQFILAQFVLTHFILTQFILTQFILAQFILTQLNSS